MQTFKEQPIRVMVTTDLVARGLDVPDVSHVINFDTPVVYEDYIHRIGRTGRAFRIGHSITFVTPADEFHIQKISTLIRQQIPRAQWPAGVPIAETVYEENQEMMREVDRQKRKSDVGFSLAAAGRHTQRSSHFFCLI